ncbi:hypothetical protein MMC09_000901 [Bachmanniomyces sp. S44760]|nr:hypothetical protein [Bachmanniomyces sp. S44760]
MPNGMPHMGPNQPAPGFLTSDTQVVPTTTPIPKSNGNILKPTTEHTVQSAQSLDPAFAPAPKPTAPIPDNTVVAEPLPAPVASAISQAAQPGSPAQPAAPILTVETLPGSTIPLNVPVQTHAAVPAPVAPASPVVIGGETATTNSASQVLLGSAILQAFSGPVTVGNQQVSLAPSGNLVVAPEATTALETLVAIIAPPITIGSAVINPDAGNHYIISGQTLSQGGAITVGKMPISLAPAGSAVIIGGNTHALTATRAFAPVQPSQPPITIGGAVVTPNSISQYIVSGQTLAPGGAITVDNTPISLAPAASALVIGSSTQALTPIAPNVPQFRVGPPPITVGGSIVTPNSASQYIIAGQTLAPGSEIIVSGTPISLAPSGSALVVGSSTEELHPTPILASPMPSVPQDITIGGQDIAPNSASQYIIGGQTLAPGGPAITISGTPISLGPSGSALVIGSSTELLTPVPEITTLAAPAITLPDGETLTPNSASQYIIGSQTLAPGQAITVSGTPYSLAPGNTALVVGSSTELLTPSLESLIPTATIEVAVAPDITLPGGPTITPNSASDYVIGSQTLSPGQAITVSGTTFSLSPNDTAVVINNSTELLAPTSSAETLYRTAGVVSTLATSSNTSSTSSGPGPGSGSGSGSGGAPSTSVAGPKATGKSAAVTLAIASDRWLWSIGITTGMLLTWI